MIAAIAHPVTDATIALLRSRNDDDTPPLRVEFLDASLDPARASDIRVTRHDGSELSETEAAHVRGVIAAHAVERIR